MLQAWVFAAAEVQVLRTGDGIMRGPNVEVQWPLMNDEAISFHCIRSLVLVQVLMQLLLTSGHWGGTGIEMSPGLRCVK